MKQTRFMQVMFSAVERGDEELAAQVRDDIESAKENGVVDTDEVTYTNLGEGKVMIIDKANGEATIAEMSPEEADAYDLVAVPSEEMEKFLHPMECGNPDPNVVTEEHENVVPDHMNGVPVSQSMPDVTVMENACGEEEECEEEERSYSNVNTAVLRIFHDQEFCERLFSEVIESEETTKIGDLKIEKSAEEDQTVVVTDCKSGDQAKVSFDGDEIEITELGQKEFKCYSDLEDEDEGVDQYEPLFVVGIDPVQHVIVDSPVYDVEDAQILAQRLSEIGVIGVQIFQSPDEARAHAFALLQGAGVDIEAEDAVEEPVEKEFSDCSVYVTKYYSDCTTYMLRLFSEEAEGASDSQDVIEDAIKSGEQIENESEIITPISDTVAVVEDKSNGEFTKAVLTEEEVEVSKISEAEADELLKDVEVEDEKEEEKTFSEISRYQLRLFSDIADQDDIEKALETGDEVENEEETITPLDKDTVIVEDKKTGELTKVEVNGEGDFDVEKISEAEADKLTEEKAFSDYIYNEDGTKLFSESEPMTEYMVRLFSEDANDVDVERAMATGDEVENENETIIPVDEETAIVEDKKTGELTKMVKLDSGILEAEPISEEEAENLKDNNDEDVEEDKEDEEKVEEKEFSGDDILSKFFADVAMAQPAMQQPVAQPVAQVPMVDANGQVVQPAAAPVVDPAAQGQVAPAAPSVEVIEDKALQAVTAIQEAALAAQQEILAAKEAPVQAPAGDLKEATFSDTTCDDTLGSWLSRI